MNLFQKSVIFLFICGLASILYGVVTEGVAATQDPLSYDVPLETDTAAVSSYPAYSVKKTGANTEEELRQRPAVDLKDPENVTTQVVYDIRTGNYVLHSKVGDIDVATPLSLTPEEYQRYTLREEMNDYWKSKNAEAQSNYEDKFNITDMKFSLGPAEKVFGPGGVRLKTQGSAELSFGIKHNNVQNYSLSERLRKTTTFDFDEQIQINVNGTVGDRLDFTMNYNTESTFDFDQQMLKLGYKGREDDILQSIEAGNVSLPLNSSLIKGSSALFGVKAELQFGKLNVVAVVSQQQSESKQVSSEGGSQLLDFEVSAADYDENRHFFLSHFFRDRFDQNMSKLPYITSGVTINRCEVWITNKRGNFEQARNIVAFMDLGESERIDNSHWSSRGTGVPDNGANTLYDEVKNISGIRDIQQCNAVLDATYNPMGIVGGEDYEKIESARRLSESEYTLNTQLGFISLKTSLNADEVLAVAFEYTYNGKVYQVGEFSTDGVEAPNSLIVKMLKSSATSPYTAMWDLMMKNVYYLGGTQVQKEKFKLNVQYKNDSSGVYLNYLTEGKIKNQLLLKVMNLDRLDEKNETRPDGKFDYVENLTIYSSSGRVIFPVVEPFGEHLRKAIGNDAIADKYCFQELYDSTKVMAEEMSEKNKFRLAGEYQASSGNVIRLNAMNVPRGSVKVTAGGQTLTENVDYTVDYTMGTVTILNQSILASGNNIDVSLESQSMFNMQRKTLVGTHLEYAFNKDFSVGGTIMHLSEMPLVTKTEMGAEPISNTLWGLNAAYKTEAQWLTKAVDALPLINATAPSNISFNGEFAHMIPGHRKIRNNPGYAYLDDFESTETTIDLRYPYYWNLASTPYDNSTGALFPEAGKSNNTEYGKNRALFSWYSIDNSVFNRNNSSTPDHIRQDKNLQSNHLTREVLEQELFPNRDAIAGQSSYLPVLNVSFYPEERGPYNLDLNLDPATGKLLNPETRWGGMMRKIETSDFETANIEYIEFWMMDPFVNDTLNVHEGGDLYFNIGDISEDILKDGKKFFENGLPANGDTTQTDRTVWGRVPRVQSTVLAFDADAEARTNQDVGYDGLKNDDEYTFDTYRNYLEELRSVLSPATVQQMEQDMFSPFNDPAGDNYHHFRGSDYDDQQLSILERYKRYNGAEGNSPAQNNPDETYSTSATTVPNAEDINQDNTLNEYEKYYQYRISLRRNDMEVGRNYIVDRIESTVTLANGTESTVTWYQFKVPIREYDKRVGAIRDFKSIRFMRMFMTGFKQETHLRFGTLELVRGEWRGYTKDLFDPSNPPTSIGELDVTAVNIEENDNKEPVNYVLPPGVTRQTDPSQPQLTQQNEQAMVLKAFDLAPGDARAVYKNIVYDMRMYGRLQMYVHAEKLIDDDTDLRDYEMTAFIRLGSDHTNNYYEYEIPLKLTPEGHYTAAENSEVWPSDNMFDFPLELLTQVKTNRNRKIKNSAVSMSQPYSEYDPDKNQNKITVVGNPNLGDVQTMMIGIRNQARKSKDIEVWVNELRLTDFDEEGGWGALGNLSVGFSDFGAVNVSARYETAGFGGIEETLQERRLDNYYQVNVSTQFDLGRFFPEKAAVRIPLYYSYGIENSTPKYNPYDEDILMEDALEALSTQEQRDSLKEITQTKTITESFNLTNVMVDIRSKKAKIYDPANFSVSYAYTNTQDLDPETERNFTRTHVGSFNYNFSTTPTPWEPFKNVKALKGKAWQIIRDFNINYIPQSIAFNINVNRQYSETQLRDLTSGMMIDYSDPNNSLLSFAKDFTWDRAFDLKYDLTKSLKFTLSTATNSRIDETMYGPVNREFFPDEYEAWKDTVMMSLRKGGRPIAYQQIFTAQWDVPFKKIPILDWVTGKAQYNATYNWDTGMTYDEELDMGNTVSNLAMWQADGQLNFETLYNKSKYLKNINQKYSGKKTAKRRQPKFQPKNFTEEITIEKGKKLKVNHKLNSDKLQVLFTDSVGKPLKMRYKITDKNNIEVSGTGNLDKIKVNITTLNPNIDPPAKKALEMSLRFLMMIRRVQVSYKQTSSLVLPGFDPSVNFFGQGVAGNMLSPGLDFSFGVPGRDYLDRAIERGWIVMNDSIINPATYSLTTDFDAKVNLEPLPGLKIDINAKRVTTDQSSIQYMYEGMPTTMTGTFRMTTVAIGTAFWSKGNSMNNYKSRAFDNMMANRQYFADKLQSRYAGTRYPSYGFMNENKLAGQTYNPANGAYSLNSPDVLIPAFLAAYTGRSVETQFLSPFPSLLSLLPNWKISYDGLSKIPGVDKFFQSITLNHAYQCTYSVGSYSSFSNYVENEDGFGFVRDVTSGNPIPSSAYDIASVAITESFAPLVSVDVAMKNSFTGKLEFRKQRTLTLNLASNQIMEATNDEWVVGVGYVIKDFDIILKLKENKTKKVKNDLTTRLDFSFKDISTLLRRIDSVEDTQATNGNKTLTVKFTADYVFSSKLNLKFYCDYQTNAPYISTSYPISTLNLGFSIKFMLTR